jgi:hypothetical protein
MECLLQTVGELSIGKVISICDMHHLKSKNLYWQEFSVQFITSYLICGCFVSSFITRWWRKPQVSA